MRAASRFVICLLASAGLLIALRPVEVRGQAQPPTQPGAKAPAQPAPQPQPHPGPQRAVIVIDPAHGGTDPGVDLGNKIAEKDVTLALASKLRTALAAQGFTIVLTRDADAATPITSDQRAQTANHSHALACISLHATRSGSGVHIYTSALQPASGNSGDDGTDSGMPTRWQDLQERFVTQSTQLAGDLRSAFTSGSLPADVRTATVPPIDNLACPAVAIEFAPIQNVSTSAKAADDSSYQTAAVNAVTAASVKWRADTAPQPQPASSAKDAQ